MITINGDHFFYERYLLMMFNGEPNVDQGIAKMLAEFNKNRDEYLSRKYVDYFILLTEEQSVKLRQIMGDRSFESLNLEEKLRILRLMERTVTKNHPELNA